MVVDKVNAGEVKLFGVVFGFHVLVVMLVNGYGFFFIFITSLWEGK